MTALPTEAGCEPSVSSPFLGRGRNSGGGSFPPCPLLVGAGRGGPARPGAAGFGESPAWGRGGVPGRATAGTWHSLASIY